MKIEDITKRIDELIGRANELLASTEFIEGSGRRVKDGDFRGFRAAGLSFFKNVFGEDHPYYKEFNEHVKNNYYSYTEAAQHLLLAAKNELQGGWATSLRGIVSAEIFADFLEMASYLLSEDYKDAAAVLVGGVLEGHLRQLATKNGIKITYMKDGQEFYKKADTINSELAGKQIYNKLDQKSITTNLDLRNKAAHGQYDQYTKAQVDLMLQSVSDFMSRVGV